MFRSIRFLLILLLATSTCYATEVEIKCKELRKNSRYDRTNRCLVENLKDVINDETKFVLTEISKRNTEKFLIVEGNLPVFTKNVFSEIRKTFSNVTHLDIIHSDVTQIDDHSFSNASQLLKLDFAENRLREITDFTFAGAENVTTLYLMENEIERVSPMAFHSMPKLEVLRLDRNKIRRLDKETFVPLVNLKEVGLQRNRLTSVDPELFIQNPRLSRLQLDRNDFIEVELKLSTTQMEEISFGRLKFEKLKLR